MKAMKKTIAVLLTLCMVVSMFALAAVTVSVGAAAGETWSVMGSFNNGTSDYDMTDNKDGTYTVAIENVAKGEYQFKVRKDHEWFVSYGKNGSNYEFTVAGVESTTVTITFDYDTQEITVTGEGVEKFELNIEKIVAVGNGSGSKFYPSRIDELRVRGVASAAYQRGAHAIDLFNYMGYLNDGKPEEFHVLREFCCDDEQIQASRERKPR